MKYANIAVDAPIDNTFDYHVPPELVDQLQPGHLVQVPFGTALQHGIVLSLHDDTPIEKTKPIHSLIDPRPLITPMQIEVARWMSKTYLAPLGLCLWLWLPPGLTGHQDLEITLLDENADYSGKPAVESPLEVELVALLKRRGSLRGSQLNIALHGKNWRAAVDGLAKAGVLRKQPVLSPPRVKPKIVQTAALAVHPNEMEDRARRAFSVTSKAADLLEYVAANDGTDAKTALKVTGASAKHVESLTAEGLLLQQGEGLYLGVPREDVQTWLDSLRKLDKPLRILSILARESEPLDVSWLYAQANCSLADLKELEDEGLVLLAEKQKWRDSLEDRAFVPRMAPTLLVEQLDAWQQVEQALESTSPPAPTLPPPPAPPRIRRGERAVRSHEAYVSSSNNFHSWSMPLNLYEKLKPIRRELRLVPTPAEGRLWKSIRGNQLEGFTFRRQHIIERFVVDFYCRDARLVIEVDGGIHQYTQEEDAIRQEFLENLGLRVIRFSNENVLEQTQSVLDRIRAVLLEQRQKLASESVLAPLPEFGTGAQTNVSNSRESTHSPLSVYGEGLGVGATFLLHGVTGSGKTEIYLRAIEKVLQQGRTAIFLVPEIALTAQTVRRVAARFPGKVGVVHSRLSDGERYDTWRRARDGIVQVIVGARSALFTPLPNLGLIILDECHDDSYKQSPPVLPPYYHARDTAEAIIAQRGGVLILGSATPDVETAYRAARGEIRLLELPRRILGHKIRIEELSERAGVQPRYHPADVGTTADDALTIDLPPVHVIDMRDELKAGNTSIFSRSLQEGLADVLRRREQAILFLNRRGQATYVFCRDCGYVATCPRCDTPLTHHRAGEVLRCHRCNYSQPEPVSCAQCGSRRIKYFGAGTQQVEMALAEMFPLARIARWDADTADSPEAHEAILQRFIDRKTDVMIGTQMVAKGLDLPLVTLVGVVSADVGIHLPDFRAGERAFQILTQVAGRAGRGLLGGQVILQTYNPQHYAIRAASHHDFRSFYEQEIAYRKQMGYPPFRQFVRVLFRFPTVMQAQAEAERAANMIRHRLKILNMTGTELIGPAPCFFERENKLFRWHLLLRGPDPTAALRDLNLPKGWHVDVDPVEVL
ncbi:MAG: primosomal protein N' [Anaerolineae bacterium]